MTDTALLKEYINKSGLKIQFLADKIGISRAALSQKISNKTEFKASEIRVLCDYLGIDSSDLDRVFFMPSE